MCFLKIPSQAKLNEEWLLRRVVDQKWFVSDPTPDPTYKEVLSPTPDPDPTPDPNPVSNPATLVFASRKLRGNYTNDFLT